MRLPLPGRSAPEPATGATASGAEGEAEPVARDAETSAPAPSWQRGERMRGALRKIAIICGQLLLIVAALYVLGQVLGRLWVILLPIVLGLLFATVLWPLTRFLRNHRWPPALAASVTLFGFLAAFAGIVTLVAPAVGNQVGQLVDQTVQGLDDIQEWLSGPPFNLGEDQVGTAVDDAISRLQDNATSIAGYGLTAATAIGNSLLNLILALILCFFFLKDGPRWVPWLIAQTGPRAAPHVAALSGKTWDTLSEFIRQQAFVGLVDAVLIGVGLWIFDVPLVLPLSLLTFFGAFIPIIGAFVAGAFAVLIALVDEGPTVALIILGLVVLVQQLEGNVLQPIIQGRGFNLHAAVVILAVTAGTSLYGITGAFLGVPVAALIAVIYRYVRDELDGRQPDVSDEGTRQQVTGDDDGARLVRAPADVGDRPGTAGPA